MEKQEKELLGVDQNMPYEVSNQDQEDHFTVSSGNHKIEVSKKNSLLGDLLQEKFNKPENKGKSPIKVDANSVLGKKLLKKIEKQNKKASNKKASNKKASNKKAKPKVKKTRIFQMPGWTSKSSKIVSDQSKPKGGKKEPQKGTGAIKSQVDVETLKAFLIPIPIARELAKFVEAHGGKEAAYRLQNAGVAPGQKPKGPSILKS